MTKSQKADLKRSEIREALNAAQTAAEPKREDIDRLSGELATAEQEYRAAVTEEATAAETPRTAADDPETRERTYRLKWAFSDPERLRPGQTRQSLTEKAAQSFATLAQSLGERGHDPQEVSHYVNRLLFCMFADDVGLLPGHMFTRMLEQARRTPAHFADLAGDLFRVMASGGRVGFETVDWFNGGLFDDETTLPLERSDIDTVLAASKLDWSEIDPSILGTLFERGLDPGKRAQLGAHYTDRDKIMLLVEPVVIRPWLVEWEAEQAETRPLKVREVVEVAQIQWQTVWRPISPAPEFAYTPTCCSRRSPV